MVLDPIPQSLPVHFFGSRPQLPTSPLRAIRCVRGEESNQNIEIKQGYIYRSAKETVYAYEDIHCVAFAVQQAQNQIKGYKSKRTTRTHLQNRPQCVAFDA